MANTAGHTIPIGPIVYPNENPRMINTGICTLANGHCLLKNSHLCTNGLSGCYLFLAPTNSLYYMTFSMPMWAETNRHLPEYSKISVWKNDDPNNVNQQSYKVREFFKYTASKSTNSTIGHIYGQFTASFNLYMSTGQVLWIENDMPGTLAVGPIQHQLEFNVWLFYDPNVTNEICEQNG